MSPTLRDRYNWMGYHRGLLSAVQDPDRDYSFQFSNDIIDIIGV